jgi:signal transduction histidine kinase/tetratricopeptide (TPR) repeat protein
VTGAFHIPGIEIEAELGHGAYSAVYRARRGAEVCAVKVPRSRGRWTRWAYREAVALARVRHRGLPGVIEVGEVGRVPFLVMELVEGETLADRLRHGTLDEARALELVTHLVEALSAVHDAGLVHRDVKPRNIIIERGGSLRLVDFGFATPTDGVALNDVAGTPGYTAPEQFQSPSQVDARADLYAVGQVLLECLTGRAPEAAEESHSGESPAPPDALGLSGPMGTLIAGLRAHDPEQRYPDARSVLRELDLVRAGQPPLGPGAYEPAPKRMGVLIGREEELALFGRAWDSVVASRGSSLVVQGPRGGGKTRLLRAFAAAARESGAGRVLEAQCRDHDPPLAVLRRILEAFLASVGRTARRDRAADLAALREAASEHLAGFATLIAPKLAAVLGESGAGVEAVPGGFPEGAAELLVRLARVAGPLLISIDDAHWVDPISRQVLLRVAHRAASAPILLALSARRRGSEPLPWPELTPGQTVRLELLPLDERHVAALVASHLGEPDMKPELARRVGALADGTPLGVLDVLGAMLDLGAVRPREGGWVLDAARMESVALPDGSLALLGRRVAELPATTRSVLEVAALLGTAFEDSALGRVVAVDSKDQKDALAEARRAGLLETSDGGHHRFVHDAAREMLASGLDPAERRKLHARIAESLDGDASNVDALCAAATHYALADLEENAPRAFRASRAAAEAALGRFDNETALRFLDFAQRAAGSADIPLDAYLHRSVGEAQLRLGAHDESLAAFEAALATEPDELARAALHGRVAWVRQAMADPDCAWASLEKAFHAIGVTMPVEGVGPMVRVVGRLLAADVGRRAMGPSELTSRARAERELLCDLHYQNARLGLEYSRRQRMVASAVEALRIGETLGPSRSHARSRVFFGFVLTALGLREQGAKELAKAERMAREVGDPVTLARCTQSRAIAASFAVETERSLELLRDCLDTYGPWLELNEYFLDAATGELLESVRGKSTAAWAWIERAVDRQERGHHPTAAFHQFLMPRVRACLAALGRRAEPGSWLAAQMEGPPAPPAKRGSFYRTASWGPRARLHVESGELGPAFEALVRDFEGEGHKPRSAHPALSEYYIAVAHGRVHQLLRAPEVERAERLRPLERALADLRAMRRAPGQGAHCMLVQGVVASFRGERDARRLLAEAEERAEADDCPWILYAIARARAHRLRDLGRIGAARDQARIAEMLAREHGAEPRARWVREEFGISSSVHEGESLRTSAKESPPHASVRQLAGLLRLLHSPDLRPEQQATAMLDDLLRDLDADRGLILFCHDASAGPRLMLGRDRRGEEWSDVEGWRVEWLESVRETSRPWPLEEHGSSHILGQPVDAKRLLAAPLSLADKAVGAISLERGAGAPAFTTEERELLRVLSRQMPVSLEIAQLFVEREQLHATLRQAQKMEAVGQLAGGLAHDFDNMMTAITGSLAAIRHRTALDREVSAEAQTIADVTQRAGRLMKQLLNFSRKQGATQTEHTLNDLIKDMLPMLTRLTGDRVQLVLALDPDVSEVKVGRSNFDQAMVNLVVNARDAMPSGGTITITTRDCVLTEDMVRRGAPNTGPHVQVEVTDTGHGISPEHLHQIFDPFFTTKPAGSGTGIGLATVYAFVRDSNGHVEVSSVVGRGTTMSLFFPTAEPERAKPVSSPPPGEEPDEPSRPDPPKLASSA